MIYALIFAGGVGQRMHSTNSLPKQFLKVHGKEIIVHTIEKFQECKPVDKIVVVCIKSYIDFMHRLVLKYNLDKVVSIVPGGINGQDSIYNGVVKIKELSKNKDDIVLIHDGVRPIIDCDTIVQNIKSVQKFGTGITVSKSIETVLLLENKMVEKVVDREKCFAGKAPQSFYVKDIYSAHVKAREIGKLDFIDSAMLMQYFGFEMHTVLGPANNIKVTTLIDFYMFRAILDAKENEQIEIY